MSTKLVANWDINSRMIWEELEQKPDSEKTPEELRFCINMYHMEECMCGLDGD